MMLTALAVQPIHCTIDRSMTDSSMRSAACLCSPSSLCIARRCVACGRRKSPSRRRSRRRRVTLSHDRAPAGQPARDHLQVRRRPRRDVRPRTTASSSTSWTPTTSGCGPTTTIRRRRRRSGSRARRSNTRGRCSCRSIPYVGDATIQVGPAIRPRTSTRLTLAGEDVGAARLQGRARSQLLPQTENIFMMFKDGWHPAEAAAQNAPIEWQWTKKEATLAFQNPKKDVVVLPHVDNPGSDLHGAAAGRRSASATRRSTSSR